VLEDEGVIYAGCDPLLVLFKSEFGVSVAVVLPQSFLLSNEIVVTALSSSTLASCSVKAHVLKIRHIVHADGDLAIFNPSSFIGNVSVSGAFCSPINMDLLDTEGKKEWQITNESLRQCMEIAYAALGHLEAELTSFSHINSLPYCQQDIATFVVLGTESLAPSHRSRLAVRVACVVGGCGMSFPSISMRHHMGGHLLIDPQSISTIYPCGFCGGESIQHCSDPTQANGCQIWLSPTAQPLMNCKLVGTNIKYSIKAAAKSSKPSPCTNRPMKCPSCPSKRGASAVVHWKLNMKRHFERVHPGAAIPAELRELLETNPEEIELIRANYFRRNVPAQTSPSIPAARNGNDSVDSISSSG